ncbi:sulfite exporter TauE/SafE family protein [Tepidiphilus baoligensis]|uniref:Probable membrane transporter protein n=1 Tax=Tepidiphilus baoligensis TaxID=2698687 RepID=A0ABX1QQ68_9PROT|nr:sulfite exporter TauE/SafE family protein [Tepidiphilus baoligensis]NMH17419.1 TSUP family transporter [Tepidiphilus baoligensis]
MTASHWILLALGGFGAGAMNAIAGGGTFLSFPTLLAIGLPPVTANASNSVALWPASLASAWAYRRELARYRRHLPRLTLAAFLGGALGGGLLLVTSNALFARLVPWLLLTATLLFALAPRINRWLEARRRAGPRQTLGWGGTIFQLLVSVYGGFFGAGMGIVMIAAIAMQGIEDINEINALKNWLSAVIYSVAALTFTLGGAVSWPHTLVVLLAAAAGGYLAGRIARRLPAIWLRRFILLVGTALTLYYFFF